MNIYIGCGTSMSLARRGGGSTTGASEHRYSADTQAALIAACPLACAACVTGAAPPQLCADDDSFTDADDYRCVDCHGLRQRIRWSAGASGRLPALLRDVRGSVQHPRADCAQMTAYSVTNMGTRALHGWAYEGFYCTESGYSTEGEAALIAACPDSCKTCPMPSHCVDSSDYVDCYRRNCELWSEHSHFCAAMEHAEELLLSCPRACGTCSAAADTPVLCADDSVFRDEQGNSCAYWLPDNLVCTAAADEHSYSADGEAALIEACPMACSVCIRSSSVLTQLASLTRRTGHARTGKNLETAARKSS